MSYYAIPVECPRCHGAVKIEKVGISAEWLLAVNFRCKSCDEGSSEELELAVLVAMCKEEEGEVVLQ